MSDEINLGVSPKEMYGDSPLPATPGSKESEPIYPVFHYSGPKELHLPDHGDMTIHFRKKSETSQVRDDGSHWYECDIQVRKICDVESEEPGEPTHRDRSAEEALDAIAEALGGRE